MELFYHLKTTPARLLTTVPTLPSSLRRLLLLLALLQSALGSDNAWAQTGTDYSGVYYLVNCGSGKSGDPQITSSTDPSNYFYLVPADNPQQDNKRDAWFSSDYSAANGDPEKPYLTSYKTNRDAATVPTGVTNRPHNSVWIVKFASTNSGTDYYYIIHAATGKYVVYEPPYSDKNNRKSVHLLTTDSPGENAQFAITTNSSNYNFRPKSIGTGASTNKYLNTAQQNYNVYNAGEAYADNPADHFRGLVGLWKDAGGGSDWKPEATLLTAPTINLDSETNTFTITYDKIPTGYTILYTTDDSEPTIGGATTSTYDGSSILVTTSYTVKAVVARYGMVLTEVAEEAVAPVPCATPVITYDNTTTNVTISCTTPSSTIHYTTDNSEPTTTSTEYSGPFSVTSPTTVKAIATHAVFLSSNVAELAISQVATPTIQNNGSNAISITTTTPGATIYYTTDGSTPTTSSTEYSGPLTDDVSNVTIKAIAVKAGMITSAVGSGMVMLQCAAPVISFDDATSMVTIVSAAEGSTIYYTTDGNTPTASSTLYSEPFSVSSTTTVKAITTKPDYESSTVTELTIYQVATPTIQNNGDNSISITTTTHGATIYYTTDESTPTTSSTEYSVPLTDDLSNVTIKAIAVKAGMITSAVGSGTVKFQCATPVITRTGLTFTLSCSKPTDADLYYTLGGGAEVAYTGTPVSFTPSQLPMIVTAVARHSDYTESATASMLLNNGEGTPEDPYMIYSATDFTNFVTNVNNGTTASASYKLGVDVSASGFTTIATTFSGTLEAAINPETQMPYRITDLDAPLFTTLTGTVRNMVLEDVNISSNTGNTGAIACTANGAARIYNVGILSGSVGGTEYTGGLVGLLDGTARVVNCYSYANITSGTDKGGIVGYNNIASTQSNVATMVMNCMFYGTIASGGNVSPVYGGLNIDNKNSGGLATYNYYLYRTDLAITDNKYNCALAVEEKFFNRFELYRQLVNSNKKLASIYATGSATDADQKMFKWVLETADRTIANPKPYPILKAQGKHPSIINHDVDHAPDSTAVGRNHGGKLGKTLTVTISGVGSNAPEGARINTSSLTLQRTDKDFDRFNFNYDKVQLPYYNDIGDSNYTRNRVVTGWKITSITGGTAGTYSAADEWGGYNFADRNCTNKDKFDVSGRVFSQGAYFEVPYGVTGITIEPYWGVAAYVSDQYYDVVYKEVDKNNYAGQSVNVATAGLGTQATNDTDTTINGSTQKVYTSINAARSAMDIPTSGMTVYDYAVVLVGNVHQAGPLANATTPYTITSVDLDKDNEPDYSFIFSHYQRQPVSPIRFDFLNVVGTAQAQKPNGTSVMQNVSIFKPKGWFEVTNTCNIYVVQFEGYNGESKTPAPIILLGGVFDQFASTQNQAVTTQTQYIHLGSNCWFKAFGNGTHGDGWSFTQHVPVSVTGGDFDGFYLSGVYRPDAGIQRDNAECYISSGRFNEVAGAAQQMIDGDVHWQIYNADITDFYGGGINAAKPITGDITVDITNSYVETYCGGPKFGDMQKSGTTFTTTYSTKQDGSTMGTYSRAIDKDGKVTTNATGCEFNKFFGAGYGGTSYSETKFHDAVTYDFSTLTGNYTNERGKYFDGQSSRTSYGKKGPGVAIDFSYEFFIWSTGQVGARFYVKYASFSLAQCNDVESNLKHCIVNSNFYGGGSLGKVVGTVTSELDSCRVKGNVYGAGFSATIPTIAVRDGGFASDNLIPKFNSSSGMFEPGVFSGTTEFHWKHVDSYPTNNTTGMSADSIVTTINLSKTNLGSIDNTVTLTLTGNTVVGTLEGGDLKAGTGSVYGGGEESAVNGNTHVLLKGSTHVLGDVFGGGDEGPVDGSTSVEITN